MIKVQKYSKEIGKIIHVTSGAQRYLYEATRILFVRQKEDLKFISSVSPYIAILENNNWTETANAVNMHGAADTEERTQFPKWSNADIEEMNCWIKTLFLFYLHTKIILAAS